MSAHWHTYETADLAAAWFGVGELDKTFHYLNEGIDRRMGPVTYFLEYPAYYGIKKDPRYNELVERMKFNSIPSPA